MPIRLAILPARWMRTRSSAVVAISKVSGWAATMRFTVSICSKVALAASTGAMLAGT